MEDNKLDSLIRVETVQNTSLSEVQSTELTAKAVTSIAHSLDKLSTFLTNGGLANMLAAYTRGQALNSILGGLTANEGRQGLDARTMKQNAIDSVHLIEEMFRKYGQHLSEKRDPEVKNPESEFNKWEKENES